MITERDLDEAIAKCYGEENPTNNTCIRLAAFLTIRNHMFPREGEDQQRAYSHSGPDTRTINYDSDSEFFRAANGKDQSIVFNVVDELMDALQVINPRLYMSVIQKLEEG